MIRLRLVSQVLPRAAADRSGAGQRRRARLGARRRAARADAAGVTPDVVAGTSIGALIAGVHLAGHLPTLEAWARKLTRPRLSPISTRACPAAV